MPSVLTDVDTAKVYLGIPAGVTQHDALLSLMVAGVDRAVAAALGLPSVAQATYTQLFDVPFDRQRYLLLDAVPVNTVSSVVDDGTTLTEGTDYYVEDAEAGMLRLIDDLGYWTQGNQTVTVEYTAGWDSSDAEWPDFQALANGLLVEDFNRLPRLGLASERLGGHTVQQGDAFHSPPVQRLINRYRRASPRLPTGR